MNTDYKQLEHLAAVKAISNTDSSWSNWNSPIGLVIFFNGLALFAILIRFAFLMK